MNFCEQDSKGVFITPLLIDKVLKLKDINMKNKIIIILTSLLSLSAISVFAHNTEKQEVLYGVSFYENSIDVIVKSNGCTKARDFRLEELKGQNHTLLNVIRIKADRCRAMSKPVMISFPLKSKQQTFFKINNSFVSGRLNIKLKKTQRSIGGEK